MKYLILAPKPGVQEFDHVLVFAAPLLHADVAAKWAATHHPVSAGYLEFSAGNVRTFGHSTSLGLSPRPIDAALIAGFERATNAMAEKSARPAA